MGLEQVSQMGSLQSPIPWAPSGGTLGVAQFWFHLNSSLHSVDLGSKFREPNLLLELPRVTKSHVLEQAPQTLKWSKAGIAFSVAPAFTFFHLYRHPDGATRESGFGTHIHIRVSLLWSSSDRSFPGAL